MLLPARQRREARPTLALALLLPLFVAPIGLFVWVAVKQVTRGNTFEAALGLAFATTFIAVYAVCAVFLLGSAQRPGVVARTSLVPLGPSPEIVRARIRAAASPSQRLIHEDSERMIVLLGAPVASARMRGGSAVDTPLRVDIELGAAAMGYREASSATIVVRELLTSSALAVDRAESLFASLCAPT